MNKRASLFEKVNKNLSIKHIKFPILVIFICVFGFLSSEKGITNSYNLHLKQVSINPSLTTQSGYESGKKLFPEYQYHGLPEDFLIKKRPDISFSSDDIKSIEIDKMPFYPVNKLEYEVTINFHPSSAERLFAYTKQKTNQKIALEIDNRIFVIATILDPLRTKMVITVGNKTVNQIRNELSKICNNIILGSGIKD